MAGAETGTRQAHSTTWNTLAQTLALFAVGPLIPPVVRTIAKRAGYLAFGGVTVLSAVVLADTVEYGEWRTGSRTEGTTYAAFSFTRKMGQALGGILGAFGILSIAVMAFYPLTEEKFRQISAEIAARRAGGAT